MKKFTVKRKKWARGGQNGEAALLNRQGCMCCLGFAANQISRIPKKQLADEGEPCNVYKASSFLTIAERNEDCELDIVNNDLSHKAIVINDDEDISDRLREEKLKKLFRKHGVLVKFVD